MIRRYFYIFAASLFILLTPTTGVKAHFFDPKIEALERLTNSPPDGFNYQAVLRDDAGDVLANSTVSIRFTLIGDDGNLWIETHNTTTNAFGVVTVVIGSETNEGGIAASFAAIDWSANISVQVEADSGNGFVNLGTSALQGVPYAQYAENGLSEAEKTKLNNLSAAAEANVQADWATTDQTSDAFIQNKPGIPSDVSDLTDTQGLLAGSTFDGSYNSLTDVPTNLDTDATDDFSGSYNDLSDVPTNMDTDATDDFSGSYNDLSDVPANLDTDATDDFSGSYNDLSGVPANLDTDATDDFSGSYNDLTDVPTNLDTDATDDFSGSYNDLTDVPANLDTDATDDFSGSYNDLTDVPANLDTDATDDFSGSYNDLTDVPANLDTDATDDFSGSYNDLTDVPANLDTDATDDFSGSYNDLTDVPANLDIDATDDFSGSYNDLSDVPANLDTDATDDFSGSYNDLTDVPANLDIDATDDFSGSFNDLTDVPADLADGDDTGAFTTASNIISAGDTDDSFVFGDNSMEDEGTGTSKMFFDKNKSAFRAGSTYNNEWDDANRGSNSFAAGYRTIASGNSSVVSGGYVNYATGSKTAIGGGSGNTATGNYSTIPGGQGLETSSYGAVVLGIHNNTTGGTSDSFEAAEPLLVVGNGVDSDNKSDAMVMLKNGNTDINGTLVANSLGVDGAFTLPTADGTNGQVLSTNGSGSVGWSTVESPVFSNTSNVIAAGDADDDFVFGSTQLAGGNGSAYANRMFFDKSKSAFRVGQASGTSWDDANVGLFSFAAGRNTTASGYGSVVAGGASNTASATISTIGGGYKNTASGDRSSIGGGQFNTASGVGSAIGGGQTHTASGYFSTIGGGLQNTASGYRSSIGGGIQNTAAGENSAIPGGRGLRANAYGEVALGFYNTDVTPTSASAYEATDRLLVVGNGNSTTRSDAMVMLKNGNTDINGTLVANSLGVDGQFTLPTSDGTSGQVLSTDGSGTVAWSNVSGGSYAGSGSGSFVAGSAANTASGSYATVNGGKLNTASGVYSTVSGGFNNSANYLYSTVSGGRLNVADYDFATVSGGGDNKASATLSTVGGGYNNTASGEYSTIPGGLSLQTSSYGATVLGVNNATTGGSYNSFVSTDPLLVIGNGESSRSDAMVMLKNGNTDINGVLVANSLGVDGQFTLPTSDGTSGQVLSTDGSGTVAWSNVSGGSSSTFLASSNAVETVPDNTDAYYLSIDGSVAFTVTMPSASDAGDKVIITLDDLDLTSGVVNFSGATTIQSIATSGLFATLSETGPTIELIFNGTTWLVINGDFTYN